MQVQKNIFLKLISAYRHIEFISICIIAISNYKLITEKYLLKNSRQLTK